MNSKAYFYVVCLAVAATFAAPRTLTARPTSMSGLSAAPLVACQVDVGSQESRKAEAERLLRLARQAMNRGEFDTSERYIVQAERLNVRYEPLYERFMDTPAKARKTLQELRGTNTGSPQPPASTASPAANSVPAGAVAPAQRDPLSMITGDARGIPNGPAPGDYRRDRQSWLPSPPVNPQQDLDRSAMRDRAITSPDQLANGGLTRDNLYPTSGQRQTGEPRQFPAVGGEPRRLPEAARNASPKKREVQRLLATARAALDRGDALTADKLARQAAQLGVADQEYGPGEIRPEHLLMEINSVLTRQQGTVAQTAYNVAPAYDGGQSGTDPYPVRQGYYNPATDSSRNVPASVNQPARNEAAPPLTSGSTGMQLYLQGLQALESQERDNAMDLFGQAWKYEAQLDPVTRQALRDKLTLLRAAPAPVPRATPGSPLEIVNSQQELLRQKIFREITREQSLAEQMRETDPRGSLKRLQDLRRRVEQEQLDPPTRSQMLTLVDRNIRQAEIYIDTNRADIELRERNESVVGDINRERQANQDIQNKLAELLEEFNDLIDERRFSEAEVLAKQARELSPDSEVVQSMLLNSQLAHRVSEQQMIQEMREDGFVRALNSVDDASTPFDDRHPLQYTDATAWADLSTSRIEWLRQQHTRLTPAEQIIQESLKTKVDVRFDNRPLSEVMDSLGRMAGVNVYLDPQGLHAEGVTTDEPITVNLTQPISLQSAMNLILEPLRLSYVIQNEVLRITSEQTRDSDVYPHVYNVADLVIPIPNFTPSYNIGLPGALKEAVNSLGYGQRLDNSQALPLTFASADAGNGGSLANASVLAQMSSSGMLPSASPRSSQQAGMLPGSMGGASMADFDTLIDLITSTIAPQTWDAVGGPGSVEGFPTNLSLVVSQTQEVHEQIADLLDQLRRLQDLQVTIEVRYITLNDRFFERIGIDFDFDVDDNTSQIAGQLPILPDDTGPSTAFGLDPTGNPTIDYDYSFTQDSFASTIPQFGGFDASTAANIGFALLSDIEVYFLLQAAQGDDRTNVLQAPKVTLFNGQTGFVSDSSQRPFVTSVIPVVGDFAAAHQPVVVVLSEGTSLSVQAVVSPDRRFVRLTLIPFFSSIGDVDTFTFNGRRTSDSGTSVVDPANEGQAVQDNQMDMIEGTTVQLPTFNFTTVSTTVSVPDGGTVLLGGIKRLSEGRNERGVPMLSKLPYINRLFRNVGIGRDTQSLMMMVTPRIIIQEEEEFLQTGYDSSQN